MSRLNREQLIEELLDGRSASFQRYANGAQIDFRSGEPGLFGRDHTPITDMQRMHAPKAEIRAAAETLADEIIAEDNEIG